MGTVITGTCDENDAGADVDMKIYITKSKKKNTKMLVYVCFGVCWKEYGFTEKTFSKRK